MESQDVIKVGSQKHFEHFTVLLLKNYGVKLSSAFDINSLNSTGIKQLRFKRLCAKYTTKKLKTYWLIENRGWKNVKCLKQVQIYCATNNVRACIEVYKCLEPHLSKFDGSIDQINAETLRKLIPHNGLVNNYVQLPPIRTYEPCHNSVILEHLSS